MGALMTDAFGVGLAATQVGILHRVFVYRAYADDEVSALVNPVIEHASEELEVGEEGCLSIPGVHVDVERPAEVRMRGQDADGNDVVVSATGLEARVLQHELDHLDGVLILDRISREQRKEAMRALREAAQGGGEPIRRRPLEARDGSGDAHDSSVPASADEADVVDGQVAVPVESTRA
jgi:peptide deformylase